MISLKLDVSYISYIHKQHLWPFRNENDEKRGKKKINGCWLKNNKFETTLIYDISSPFCLFIHNAINCRHLWRVRNLFFFYLTILAFVVRAKMEQTKNNERNRKRQNEQKIRAKVIFQSFTIMTFTVWNFKVAFFKTKHTQKQPSPF